MFDLLGIEFCDFSIYGAFDLMIIVTSLKS